MSQEDVEVSRANKAALNGDEEAVKGNSEALKGDGMLTAEKRGFTVK